MAAAALVLAAGEGTRMKSGLPKVAHPVLGVPMIQLVLSAASQAGVDPVVVVTGHGAEIVESLVGEHECIRQPEQLGTGHAVMCARDALAGVEGSLLVLSGDTPLLRPETIVALVEAREGADAAVAVLTATTSDPGGYGRVVRDEAGQFVAIVEQKDLLPGQEDITEVNTGTYCFDAEVLFQHIDSLGDDNAQGEFYLTDMVSIFLSEGLAVVAVAADEPSETMGINTRVQLAEATRHLQRRVNERLMLDGVTIISPELAWVSPTVQIGRDVTIEPMTSIIGGTRIGEGSHIGPSTRLADARIGKGARVDQSVVIDAEVGDGASVGPMAYLRPGTVLAAGAKAGTFVELKKSSVGEGSKVPHLSYIGDASIGDGVNVGAGTITCNYDGFGKYATEIGDGAFIGSDTMLVAPVSIGSGAVVGAGSVITEDVPDDALGLTRPEQKVVADWAKRRRGMKESDTEKDE